MLGFKLIQALTTAAAFAYAPHIDSTSHPFFQIMILYFWLTMGVGSFTVLAKAVSPVDELTSKHLSLYDEVDVDVEQAPLVVNRGMEYN